MSLLHSASAVTFVAQANSDRQGLRGAIRVPGDKSMSHRAIIFGALAQGTTHISGFLEGEDSLATLQAFRDMGVDIEHREAESVRIQGVGLHGLRVPAKPLDLGNSGTAMRLMVGVLAAQPFSTTLIGDTSLSARPMRRVIEPLQQMGARIDSEDGMLPPLKVMGGKRLQAIEYTLPMASAQVKSCVLLAGLYASGETVIHQPAMTRDHTERMLQGFGCRVSTQGLSVRMQGGQTLQACSVDIPADVSSAAFFMVAASIVPGSDVLLQHVGINPTRDGVVRILKGMGADIELINERDVGGERVADIRVRYAKLKGVVIPEALVPSAIDEFPVLFIAATQAEGETILTGAEELRVKESDRIAAMAVGLSKLGVDTTVTDDGIRIPGGQVIHAGQVDSLGDHRIAMAFSVAGQLAQGPVEILNCANVATSFPSFVTLSLAAGMQVTVHD